MPSASTVPDNRRAAPLPRRRAGSPGTPPAQTVSAAPTASVEIKETPARTIDELLAELDVSSWARQREGRGAPPHQLVAGATTALRAWLLPTIEVGKHLVFTGNPGTGKTTVGRLLSQIHRAVGVVTRGHLVETDRSKLVAGYVGQTALKTQQTLEASLGGMLLIDEAYSLAPRRRERLRRGEAIDTLVKSMEDHRDDLAIVAAGYVDEMQDFIDTNPGLKSRFTRTVLFPDYTTDELVAIFVKLGDKHHYHRSDGALARVRTMIEDELRTRGFGNARFVRNSVRDGGRPPGHASGTAHRSVGRAIDDADASSGSPRRRLTDRPSPSWPPSSPCSSGSPCAVWRSGRHGGSARRSRVRWVVVPRVFGTSAARSIPSASVNRAERRYVASRPVGAASLHEDRVHHGRRTPAGAHGRDRPSGRQGRRRVLADREARRPARRQ
ncbi:MAG: AAA family ATPase [Ilumatobacteraceae bacterium]